MTRKNREYFTQISAQVSIEFRDELTEYCERNNVSISNLVRKALLREMGGCPEFHQVSENEKMMRLIIKDEVKKEVEQRLNIVDVDFRKVN
jgi:hypothetical protein